MKWAALNSKISSLERSQLRRWTLSGEWKQGLAHNYVLLNQNVGSLSSGRYNGTDVFWGISSSRTIASPSLNIISSSLTIAFPSLNIDSLWTDEPQCPKCVSLGYYTWGFAKLDYINFSHHRVFGKRPLPNLHTSSRSSRPRQRLSPSCAEVVCHGNDLYSEKLKKGPLNDFHLSARM